MKDKIHILLFFMGFIIVLLAGWIYSYEDVSYIGTEISKLFSRLCIFEAGFSLFVSFALTIITKLSWDNDKEYIARILVAFHFAFVLILGIITIYFKMSCIPIILLIISLIIFVYLLWKQTPKRELIS